MFCCSPSKPLSLEFRTTTHLFVKKWGWGKSNKQEIEDKRQHLMMEKEKN
tara:strand:+ start:297 stop:446 length:150 start_codon:yes stop_codon:yes gene_type:complete